MKKYVSLLLRNLKLAGVADKIRFQFIRLLSRRQNKKFQDENPHFVFPPAYFIYETYVLNYKDYLNDGRETAITVKQMADPFIDLVSGQKVILDWGCGPGRTVRHLPEVMGAEHTYYGCDYNETYISWCEKNIKGVSFFKNELSPPLKLADSSIDMAYGLSILTHLSEQSHYEWMKEFFRILKPGGIVILTTHGNASAFKLTEKEKEIFVSGNFTARSFLKEGHRMYSSFQPEPFIRKLVHQFNIVKFIPGGQGSDIGLQDCYILQKPVI